MIPVKQETAKRLPQPHLSLWGQGRALGDVGLAYLKPVTPGVRAARVTIVFLIAALLCGLLDRTGQCGFDWLEQDAYSARMFWHTQHHPVRKDQQKVVLVTMSDETFDQMQVSGPPMPRAEHAEMIQELIKAGAGVIAFDLVFDVPRAGDAALAKAAKASGGKVLWAALLDSKRSFVQPTPQLLAASPYIGHIIVPHDSDRPAVDRVQAYEPVNERLVPSFSLAAALMKLRIDPNEAPRRVVGGWQIGKLLIPVDAQGMSDQRGTFQISYLGADDASFQRIPYEDLAMFPPSKGFTGVPPSDRNPHGIPYDFRDKIVLIGDISKVGNDIQYTPVGSMSGVEMHAHAIATLLRGSFVHTAPPLVNLALLCATALFVCLLAPARRVQRIVMWSATMFLAYLVLNVWLFEQGIALHVVGPCAALLMATLGVLIERGIAEEHERERMFDTLVTAAATAIEVRDPSTSGHSRRVTALTVDLARAVSEASDGPFKKVRFTPTQLRELRYATMLHDFGKIGVRENILTKSHKLEPLHFRVVKSRLLRLRDERDREFLEQKVGVLLEQPREAALRELGRIEEARRDSVTALDADLALLDRANDPAVQRMSDDEYQALRAVLDRFAALVCRDDDGEARPLLNPEEQEALSIRRGSLTDDEYHQIQRHASMSYDFLRLIPWTAELQSIPDIAYCHHEKLNGRGYPRGIAAPEIPLQARIMTIADIYDALTASDRAYKKSLTAEQALNILRSEALDGGLDQALLDIFISREVYKVTERASLMAAEHAAPPSAEAGLVAGYAGRPVT